MTQPLIDLGDARRHIVQHVAMHDGDRLLGEQVGVAKDLAKHLARREGRDTVATGQVLIEAASCLGGLAQQIGVVHDPGVVVLLNVLGYAGVELTGDQS